MKRFRKYLRWGSLAALSLALILVFCIALIARPRTPVEFTAANKAAVDWIEGARVAIETRPAPAPRPAADDKRTSATPAPVAAPPAPLPAFFAEVRRLDTLARLATAGGGKDYARFLDGMQTRIVWTQVLLEGTSADDALAAENEDGVSGRDRLHERLSLFLTRLYAGLDTGSAEPAPTAASFADTPLARQINAALDQTEQFLLAPGWTIDPFPAQLYVDPPLAFMSAARLSVQRALLRGDGERARQLLPRLIDAGRLLAPYFVNPSLDSDADSEIAFALSSYSRMAASPAAGLGEAMRKLETLRMPPETASQLNLNRMTIADRRKMEDREYALLGYSERYGLLGPLYRGYERARYNTLASIYDRMMTAYGEGDLAQAGGLADRFRTWNRLIGDSGYDVQSLYYFPVYSGPLDDLKLIDPEWLALNRQNTASEKSAAANDSLDTLLALAAVERYGAEHGAPPASFADLGLAWPRADETNPAIWRLTAIPGKTVAAAEYWIDQGAPPPGRPDDRFTRLAAEFKKAKGRLPASIDDLRPFAAPGEDIAAFNGRFVRLPAMTAVLRMRPMPDFYRAMVEIQQARKGDLSTPPTAAEREKLESEAPSGLRQYEVRIAVVLWPAAGLDDAGMFEPPATDAGVAGESAAEIVQ